MKKFVFIGGLKRGFQLIENFSENSIYPEMAFILKEDEHEIEKYSDCFSKLIDNKFSFKITKKLNQEDYDNIRKQKYDFAIVCGWRTLIDIDKLKDVFKFGLLAAHDSLLPKYRGFAPSNWAIINGEKKSGLTIFEINNKNVDSGKIYFQESFFIKKNETIIDVMNKVTNLTIKGYDFLYHNIESIEPIIQEENSSSYTCKRNPNDGKINWVHSSETIHNLIRALIPPYPGAYFMYDKKIIITKSKIGRQNKKNYIGRIPGKIISINSNSIEVLCGKGSIEIFSVQIEGKEYFASEIFKSIAITL